MQKRLRVLVVTDRSDRARKESWKDVIESLPLKADVSTWSLAESMQAPLDPSTPVLLEKLEELDVVILNWDVLNGDPDYGADVALRWFQYRGAILRQWCSAGGILVLEGQAVLGIPYTEAYNAVLGHDEVLLSGLEDPLEPGLQEVRLVGGCRMTRAGRRAPGFRSLERIEPNPGLSFDVLFPPGAAGRFMPDFIRRFDFGRMLYRGWFRRRLKRGHLKWVVYARRNNRWPYNHATLIVAKCGKDKGAIFATTMLLGATHQRRLIQAILETHGNVDMLPSPGRKQELAVRFLPSLPAGLAVGVVSWFVLPDDAIIQATVSPAITVFASILIEATVPSAARHVRRVSQALTGR